MPVHRLIKRCSISIAITIVLFAVNSVVSTVSAKAAVARGLPQQLPAVFVPELTRSVSLSAGRALGGFTSQSQPVVLEISKSTKRLELAVADLQLTCSSGGQLIVRGGWLALPISASGQVHASRLIPPSGGSASAVTGGSDNFSGKLNRKKATFSGTWQMQVAFSMPSGQTDQCQSGRVTFRARL